MKKLVVFLSLAAVLGSLINSNIAFAHTLKSDGDIGAVMHTEPSDNPVVNQPSVIILDFKDKNNKFTLEGCECWLIFSKDEKELDKVALTSVSTSYVFTNTGDFEIQVEGHPKIKGDFADFKLEYPVNVVPISENSSLMGWIQDNLIPVLGVVIVIGFGIFLVVHKKLTGELTS